jgi:hypothetical protein
LSAVAQLVAVTVAKLYSRHFFEDIAIVFLEK